ncbi:MAG: mqnC de-hypoxanthine futalosine cyclase [Pseudomonadota bacterium]|jgi:cyclic dehypoxanthinyl futalosine synthase
MNPYSINCAVKPVWREFEKPLKQDSLPAGAGFQEAPTLEEINARDSQRQQLIHSVTRDNRVHDELMVNQIQSTQDPLLKSAYETALAGGRLTGEQGQVLLDSGDLNLLGWLATRAKERFHPTGKVSFLLDRNINYTNICRIGCDFCAFYRRGPESDAYVLPKEEIFKKIEETIELGGTGTLMQGGVNPHLKIEYYEDLFRSIKERYKIHLHALSVIEIEGIAQVSRLTVAETLERLKAAGLDSIPGAGAEILSDEIRLEQSPVKRHSHRWIKVMQEAHKANLPTTATMMFGALEERKHVIEHILRIRDAQDETQGFYAFILWTFQGENTELAKKNPDMQPTSGVEYLRVLAVSRLMMDNIPNIQGSWVTMGPKIGQISLHYGANDMGSIMIEENVVSAAGTSYTLDRKNMIELIRRSGFTPVQRDTYYNILAEYPESPAQ